MWQFFGYRKDVDGQDTGMSVFDDIYHEFTGEDCANEFARALGVDTEFEEIYLEKLEKLDPLTNDLWRNLPADILAGTCTM